MSFIHSTPSSDETTPDATYVERAAGETPRRSRRLCAATTERRMPLPWRYLATLVAGALANLTDRGEAT